MLLQEFLEGIHLVALSSASPELQSSEWLWLLTNEGFANRFFEEIEDLEDTHLVPTRLRTC
jgi:hypothetical protein